VIPKQDSGPQLAPLPCLVDGGHIYPLGIAYAAARAAPCVRLGLGCGRDYLRTAALLTR
jgi:hypothetical protein